MPLSDEDVERIAKAVHGGGKFGGIDLPLAPSDNKLPPWRYENLSRAALALDVDALADAVVRRLPKSADAKAVARAVRDELAGALGD